MLNQVQSEGFVSKKVWKHSGDTFFRLVIYRDPDRPRKEAQRKSPDERDQPDYITVRVPAALTTLPVEFQPGQRVQIHGWLECSEFEQTLAEFLQDARGSKPTIDPLVAGKVVAPRNTTWVVAERIVTLFDRQNGHTYRNGDDKK